MGCPIMGVGGDGDTTAHCGGELHLIDSIERDLTPKWVWLMASLKITLISYSQQLWD